MVLPIQPTDAIRWASELWYQDGMNPLDMEVPVPCAETGFVPDPDSYWVDHQRKMVWWIGTYPFVLQVEELTLKHFPNYNYKVTSGKQLDRLKKKGTFYYPSHGFFPESGQGVLDKLDLVSEYYDDVIDIVSTGIKKLL